MSMERAAQNTRRGDPTSAAWLMFLNGPRVGADIRLAASTTVGRDEGSNVVVNDQAVSRQHARVRLERGHYVLYDLASSSGTYVNGRRVQRQTLEDDDVIRVGQTQLRFKRA